MKNIPRNHILLRNDNFGRDLAEQINALWRGTPAEIKIPEKKEWWSSYEYLLSNAYSHAALQGILSKQGGEFILPERISERDPLANQERVSLDFRKVSELDRTLDKKSVYLDLGLLLDFSGVNHQNALHVYEQLPEKNLETLPALLFGWLLGRRSSGELSFAYPGDPKSILPGKAINQGIGSRTFLPLPQKERSVENLGLNRLIYGRLHILGGLIYTGEYDTLAYNQRCVFAVREKR
ncbi:MAG: hypothetical protein Q8Q31_05770 [Nanoarchaeota archaeon]|nr:hypothetical protein [Nanoarchaeota archaeon]